MTTTNKSDDVCEIFKKAIEDNFNLMVSDLNLEPMNFELIQPILDNLLNYINVSKKSNDKEKKRFNKFINYNYKVIENNLKINDDVDKQLEELFENDDQKSWYHLHVAMVSYLSYLKKMEDDGDKKKDSNYKGMIDKLVNKIEEFEKSDTSDNSDDSDVSEHSDTQELNFKNPQKILDQLNSMMPKTEKSSNVMNDLLGDIKGLLNKPDDISSKSIVDISKDLSSKYQTMIEKGDVNITDLLSGVMNLLNDPESLEGHFDDINSDNLPDPSKLLADMTNDPNIKKAMDMFGGGLGGGGGVGGGVGGLDLNSMMASMMGGGLANMMGGLNKSDNMPKTTEDLEKEIERLMTEINLANQENPETL